MVKLILFFFALSSWAPVLKDGRYQPYGTLPVEEQNVSELQEQRRLPFGDDLEAYHALEGKPYRFATGKALSYPTKRQLQAELLLHKLPIKWILITGYLLSIFWRPLGYFAFAMHTALLALNCYILQRPPVTNMSETILYVPWIAVLASFFFKKEREGAFIAALLLLFLPVHLHFENVQAVLDSQYWLIVHVLMVVGSYGVFFFSGLLGHLFLIKPHMRIEKTLIRSLYVGTALLIGGTILGGVWAAQSWGRFWDWDPKEAWAFIASGIYLIWIHAYRFKKISGRGLAIGAIIGLMTITFTWYGVNYILSAGLHSYGFGSGGERFYYLFLLTEVLFLTLFPLKTIYKNWKIEKKGARR